MKLQRWTWRAERGGWLLICAFVLFALLGLFSNGPLSSTTITQGRLAMDFERFQRNGAPTTIKLRVEPQAGDRVAIRLGSSFLEAFQIESVIPEPAEQRSGPDGVEMTFLVVGQSPLRVYLKVRPESLGLVGSQIGLAGEPPARFTQFVFP